MRVINREKKWIAMIVAMTFFTMIGAGSLPAATDDLQPGAVEKVTSGKAQPAKKSPLVPILIGVGAAGVIAAVLILVVFKAKYDITGLWYGRFTNDEDEDEWTGTITFTGDKKSGTLVYAAPTYNGTYSVDGKNVTFSFTTPNTIRFTGTFEDKETMSGTWRNETQIVTGTWRLTRNAVAAVAKPQIQSAPFQKK